MKANEVDILIIPDFTNADEDHWQSRWEAKLSTARRVEQKDRVKPVLKEWVAELVETGRSCRKPILLVAHALGVPVAVHAVPQMGDKICGGFFVSPPDLTKAGNRRQNLPAFGPYPAQPLPFPSLVIASRNDPFCSFTMAENLAKAWHSLFLDAGESGHINEQSGHGPWPEGLMVFSQFLANLPEAGVTKAAAEQAGKKI
ncbi:MAG: serine hydrolase family protein [Candidatus Tokpelaia sp.]|nr:MAG: serine hydrolase family protein [Candidatus Tokpelaia sp.]KAA6207649.1 MAG: serine hydrolase family protein [Candidatus Tokpelaia sp.]